VLFPGLSRPLSITLEHRDISRVRINMNQFARLYRSLPPAFAMVLLPIVLPAQQTPQCPLQNITARGAYVLVASGFSGGGPFAAVGIAVYDGAGGFQLSGTGSFNGTIAKGLSGSGTYTVNRDCTGSQTFGSGSTAAHYDFVITRDGRQITYIQTDNGATVTAVASRMNSFD